MHGWMSQIPYIESIWRAQAWRERVEVHLKVRARRLRTFRRCAKHPSHLLWAGQCQEVGQCQEPDPRYFRRVQAWRERVEARLVARKRRRHLRCSVRPEPDLQQGEHRCRRVAAARCGGTRRWHADLQRRVMRENAAHEERGQLGRELISTLIGTG